MIQHLNILEITSNVLFGFIRQFVQTFCNLPEKIAREFEENNSKSLLYLFN